MRGTASDRHAVVSRPLRRRYLALDPRGPRGRGRRPTAGGCRGLRPVGRVTDRLGRPGQAYVYDGHRSRQMLIMEPVAGAVLGLEDTVTAAEPEWGLEAGDVMDYSAWIR